jgi:PAS domain S-box-containing protein
VQARPEAEQRILDLLAELKALRESEERYRTIVDGLPEVVFQTDADHRLTFVSDSFARVTGAQPDAALGRELAELVDAEDRPQLETTFAELAAGARGEARLEVRMGGRWIELGARPRRDAEGRALGVAGILADVTERKALEAQLLTADRMASMGTLVAGVAHEINNPLASVMLNLDFIGRELAAATAEHERRPLRVERLTEPLHAAVEGVERVRDLVKNLKIFSRGDDRRRLCDVRAVLESTIRMAQTEVRHRARIVRDFHEVPAVEANEASLGQIFLNLIINAAQAIPDGHLDDHEIRVVTRTDDGGRAVIEVRDTGLGIPPENLGRIFDPFFTTKPVGVGTGLGLAICHRLVTAMGGDISVESVVGVGSVFSVTLPHAEPAAQRPAVLPAATPPPALRRGHLLVIDDEAGIGEAVRRLVVPQHQVTSVTAPEDALSLIRGGAVYDVILCDLMMPRLTGPELHAELLRLAPRLADRMVFITGGAFTERTREFLEQMPGRILEKPFDARRLAQVLRQQLRSR